MTTRPAPATTLVAATPARRLPRDAVVVTLFLLLSLVLSWPLPASLFTHVIGFDVDEGIFVWNLWWLRFSLFDLQLSPFFTDYLFYPVGVSLVYYTLTIINGVIALPVTLIFGPVLATNLVLLASLTASGYAAYRLCLYLLTRETREWFTIPAAILGGMAYAFAASGWVYASFGSANLTSKWPLPLFLLAVLHTGDSVLAGRLDRRQPLLAIVWFACAVYLELTLAVFDVFLITPFVAAYCLNAWRVKRLRALVASLAVTAAGMALAIAPIAFLVAREDAVEGQYLTDKWGYADGFSADLFSFVIPTRLHPLLGNAAREWTAPFTDVNIVYLGYGVLALGVLGWWCFRRRLRLWAASAVVYAVLCLGPVLHIFGRNEWNVDGLVTNIPLPYIVLHYIPFISANRFPNRFSIPLTLMLAVLAAYGAMVVLRRWRSVSPKLLATAMGGLLLVDSVALPLPIRDMRAPAVYSRIAAEPGDFAIAQLPLGWRNSYGVLGDERTTIQSYQAVHQKRMIGGNISRNPPFKFTYFADLPVFGTIAALEQGTPPDAETLRADREAAPALIQLLDLRYLVVQREYNTSAAESYARQALPLDLVEDNGDTALYRIRPAPPPASYSIAFGSEAARPNRGDGWTGEERFEGTPMRWSTRQEARIFLPRPATDGGAILVRAAPFDVQSGSLSIRLNGRTIATEPLRTGFTNYEAAVPAGLWRDGANHLDLAVDRTVRPRDVLPFDRAIGRTGTTSAVDIAIESASLDGGNSASIRVNGREVSRNRRGYNVAVIDAGSGRVEAVEAFDTFAEPAESARLAAFIGGLPAGKIVAVAIRDEGTSRLGEDAARALRSIGIATDMRGRFRVAQAAIGVIGAAAGTAVESTDPRRAAVRIGRAGDDRTLGIAVSTITVTSP